MTYRESKRKIWDERYRAKKDALGQCSCCTRPKLANSSRCAKHRATHALSANRKRAIARRTFITSNKGAS